MDENDDFDLSKEAEEIYTEIDEILNKMRYLTGKNAFQRRIFCEIGRLHEQVKLLAAFYENYLNRGE